MDSISFAQDCRKGHDALDAQRARKRLAHARESAWLNRGPKSNSFIELKTSLN